MHIQIKRGLDIPIKGEAKGETKPLPPTDNIALDLTPYGQIRWKLFAKEGEKIAQGAPLVYSKDSENLLITSPAGGEIAEVRRGEKMRLVSIVIRRDPKELLFDYPPLNPSHVTLDELAKRGLFAHIQARPFGQMATPDKAPSAIFIQALESAPFLPNPERQVEGREEGFEQGLKALSNIAPIHFICRKDTFENAPFVTRHTASGPHPIATPSLHIQKIHPLKSRSDLIWTLRVWDVVAIGERLRTGYPHLERVCAVAGMGFPEKMRQFVRLRVGSSLSLFPHAFSGGPLEGAFMDFLGANHYAITSLPKETKRSFFHFLHLGLNRYSFYRTYLASKTDPHNFSNRLHGEERPFVDGSVYDKVMPLPIPTMPLIKAIMAQDWEKAERYGLLKVVSEDFALPTFICPSKIEMVEAVESGIRAFLAQNSD